MRTFIAIFGLNLVWLNLHAQPATDTQLLSAIKDNNLAKAQHAFSKGANINAADSNGATALMWAIYKADQNIVNFLLERGASPMKKGLIFLNEKKTSFYGSPLAVAAGEGKIDMVKLLVEKAGVNIEDKEYETSTKSATGWRALHWSASKGHLQVVSYLIEKGAEVDAVHAADSTTALIIAIFSKKYEVSKYLLAHGAHVNFRSKSGITPLMYAASSNDFDMCVLLWQHGADTQLKTVSGKTAGKIANERGFQRVEDFLLSPNSHELLRNRRYLEDYKREAAELDKRKQYAEAISITEKARVEFAGALAQRPAEELQLIKKIAALYNLLNQFDRAESVLEQAQHEFRLKGDTITKEYAELLSELSVQCNKQENYIKAIHLMKQSASIREKLFGSKHTQYAGSVFDVGYLFAKAEQPDSAIKYYSKAQSIWRSSAGNKSADFLNGSKALAELYKQERRFQESELIYEELLELRRSIHGIRHQQYLSALNDLVELFKLAGQYDKSEKRLREAMSIAREIYGQNAAEYAIWLHELGHLYFTGKQFDLAENNYLAALPMLAKGSDTYLNCLGNLLELSFEKADRKKINQYYQILREALKPPAGSFERYENFLIEAGKSFAKATQYEQAEKICLELGDSIRAKLGAEDVRYGANRYDLGAIYLASSHYDKAASSFEQAMNIYSRSIRANLFEFKACFIGAADANELRSNERGTIVEFIRYKAILNDSGLSNDINTAFIYVATAKAYSELHKFDSAIVLLEEALRIQAKENPVDSASYATTLYLLGDASAELENFDVALEYYAQAETIRRAISENSIPYAASLYGLGRLYSKTGRNADAENSFLRAIKILKAIGHNQSRDYAMVLMALGTFYIELGLYAKAESLLLEAMKLEEITIGRNHTSYASTLNNLGGLYKELGNDSLALNFYEQSLVIREKIFGKKHPLYAECLNNIAGIYADWGDLEAAGNMYLEVMLITKEHFGREHSDYSRALNNLGFVFSKNKDYAAAKWAMQEAMVIDEKLLGTNNPSYAINLSNLASYYYRLNQPDSAVYLTRKYNRIMQESLRQIMGNLTEKEKTEYIDNGISFTAISNSLLFLYPQADTGFYRENYDLLLMLKSLSLAETRSSLESIRTNKDTGIQKLFTEWQQARTELSKQYSLPPGQRVENLKELEVELEELDKALSGNTSGVRNRQEEINLNSRKVQQSMANDEAAIEFVKFSLYDGDWRDTTMYAAYVLRKDSPIPSFIPLFEERKLLRLLSDENDKTVDAKSIYRSEIADADDQQLAIGDSLYSIIWKPLLPYLKDIKTISFSPAGLLNGIAFHALPSGENRLLIDQYNLNRYLSTRQIALRENDAPDKQKSITLFGNINFNVVDSLKTSNNASTRAANLFSEAISRSGGKQAWVSLPGTGKEIAGIQKQFEENKIVSSVYAGAKATEEQFKQLDGRSSSVLHLSTHGFFLPDPELSQEKKSRKVRNAFSMADDPMLRSGIVLAGANRAWQGMAPIEGREDGIVTAYEISQLDLSKTDLVVLSACETALGDIKGDEGVFGLQRAFKLAGVDNMLLSLWKVPDNETAELMQRFYGYYLSGNSARTSLSLAQKDLRNKYSPYYWAAFVVIE